jgi:hypothetical protein
VRGTNAEALGLTDPGASDEALIAAMIIEPVLVNRRSWSATRARRCAGRPNWCWG